MKIFAAIVTDSVNNDTELVMALTQSDLLLKLQLCFVEYWNDNQVSIDIQSLQEYRLLIQRICATKSIRELSNWIREINSEFQINIYEQEI